MPNSIVRAGAAISGAALGTAMSENIRSPKAIALFYVEVVKSCYSATGSKRIACASAAVACGLALTPGAHQIPFITACTASLTGASRL